MKKIIFVMGMVLILLFLCVSCQNSKNNEYLSKIINDQSCVKQLHEYDSPYTLCFKNKDDTFSFYLFAAPVLFKKDGKYIRIDNSILKSNKGSYAFENKFNNIKTYFPESLKDEFLVCDDERFLWFSPNVEKESFSEAAIEEITNINGDKKEAVVYKSEKIDLAFYPTNSGIKSEVYFKKETPYQVEFKVHTSIEDSIQNHNNYVTFENKSAGVSKLRSIVYASLCKNGEGDYGTNTIEMNENFGTYSIVIQADMEGREPSMLPVVIDPSFELYQSKMPDSGVFSNQTQLNAYLLPYVPLGYTERYGESIQYFRFNFLTFFNIDSKSILEANYSIRALNQPDQEVQISQNALEWSSTQMTWLSKVKATKTIASNKITDHQISFDLTEYIKRCFNDSISLTEFIGCQMKANTNEEAIFLASSDNSLYPPYLHIKMTSIPMYFNPMDDINLPVG